MEHCLMRLVCLPTDTTVMLGRPPTCRRGPLLARIDRLVHIGRVTNRDRVFYTALAPRVAMYFEEQDGERWATDGRLELQVLFLIELPLDLR